MTRRSAILLLALAAAACQPKRIPGTTVPDTPDTRAIYVVLQEYLKAMNARDPAAVLALVAPDYFDDAGTPEPADDLDRARLEQALVADLGRVESERLTLTIRKIEVQGTKGFAEVFYDSYYRVLTPAGPVPRRDSDVHRMKFEELNGQWKIASGL